MNSRPFREVSDVKAEVGLGEFVTVLDPAIELQMEGDRKVGPDFKTQEDVLEHLL